MLNDQYPKEGDSQGKFLEEEGAEEEDFKKQHTKVEDLVKEDT